jgi:hypothetical protein
MTINLTREHLFFSLLIFGIFSGNQAWTNQLAKADVSVSIRFSHFVLEPRLALPFGLR